MRGAALVLTSLVLTALILMGCGDEGPVVERAGPVALPPPATTLAGVDLNQPIRALGTEPFWAVELNGRQMIVTGVDRPEMRVAQPAPQVQGTLAVYEAESADGEDLRVTLTATECSDGMSDRAYPLSAIVEYRGETLTGCAAPTAARLGAPEDGAVEPMPATSPV